MRTFLITGGAGFFGGLLKRHLLDHGFACVSIDLEPDDHRHPNLVAMQGDIRDRATVEAIFARWRFDAVFHCAAILAHDARNRQFLWTSNVHGTRAVAELARRHGVRKLIFTSSNCLWGEAFGRPVREDDPPKPVEIYGRSKLAGERILWEYRPAFDVIIIRCPTIIDRGRLGLLSILFEFIAEGRKVWVVGRGDNRYQFIAAPDLIDACVRALDCQGSEIFHIGADHVGTLREVYEEVIAKAGSRSRVTSLPKAPTLLALKLAYRLGLSPLGPYQYKMIAENFQFDTAKIKEKLGWQPTITNGQMLSAAYQYYHEHRQEITKLRQVSAHRRPARQGIIRLVKWLS